MKQCCWLKLTRPSSCLAIPFSVRPTDWLQHCSHAGQHTDKQQHGECDYQKKCCPHVVQNGDHGTSLFLLDSLTAPSTFTVGVTDVRFNPTNAIFGRLLQTPDRHVVTLGYWQQKEEVAQDEIPYFQRPEAQN